MASGPQDKRVERSKAAVLAETYRQLTQNGLAGVSIDDVSRNSGVAKTTIYRHWPSRSALLIDACSRIGGPQAAPSTGSLRRDLEVLLTNVAEQLRTATWPRALPSIIDAAEREPEIAAMFSAMHETNMAPFYATAAQARARGELTDRLSDGDFVATTLGPLFYRRWFSTAPLDAEFVTGVIDRAMENFTRRLDATIK